MPRLQRHQSLVISKLSTILGRVNTMQAKLVGGDQPDDLATQQTAAGNMDTIEHLISQINRSLTQIETVI